MKTGLHSLVFVLTVSSFATFGQNDFEFVVNGGQWPNHVHAAAEVPGGKVYFENQGFTYDFIDTSPIGAVHGSSVDPASLAGLPRIRRHTYRTSFIGANDRASAAFYEQSATHYNFFLGNDPVHWAGNVSAFGRMVYENLYPQVDLHLYTHDYALKYDFYLAPGADPSVIKVAYEGSDRLRLKNGRLLIETSINTVVEQPPLCWQPYGDERQIVDCAYALNGDELSFRFPKGYDPERMLVIDPVLLFSTYSGSTADNFGFTATYDDDGYLYAGSSAFGAGYPLTVGAYQQTWGGGDGQGALVGTDIAITKYDLTGTTRIYSTYLGGANDELPHSLIVNQQGELMVMGTTSSPNYPVTPGSFQTNFQGGTSVTPIGIGVQYVNGSDIIVSRFSADGSNLLSSTFLGGSANDGVNTIPALKFNYADEFRGEIELDDAGNVYIGSCTFSNDFPTVNAFQSNNAGALDGCITKFSPDLTTVLYSTYYGSTGNEGIYSIDVTTGGDIFVCGGTTSATFPTTSNAYQPSFGGGQADGFMARIDESGASVQASTYFGSPAYDQCYFIESDANERPHIYGQTRATGSTFIINADYGTPNSGMLVARLSPDLSALEWSTVFGTGSGKPNLSPTAFLVDVCGKIYLSGWGGTTNTNSNTNADNVFNLDITDDAYQSTTTGSDFYLMVLEDDASDIVYGSYFGGPISAEHVDGGTSRFNRKGQIYQSVCAGCGNNNDFPIFPANAVSPTNNSNNCNNGVFKFDFLLPITIADFSVPTSDCLGGAVNFTNTSTFGQTFLWDFGDGSSSTAINPSHTYTEPGTYEVTLVVSNSETCNGVDTLTKTITLLAPQSTTLDDLAICDGESVPLGPLDLPVGSAVFWTPQGTLDDPVSASPVATPEAETLYTALINNGICIDTVYQFVGFTSLGLEVSEPIIVCNEGETVTLSASSGNENATWVWSLTEDFESALNPDSSIPDIDVVVNTSTTYYVQLSVGNCTAVGSVSVGIVADLLDLGASFTVCAGDTANLSLLNPLPGYALSWSPEALVLSGQGTETVQVFVPEGTLFELTAVSDNCEVSDEIFVSTSGIAVNQIGVSAEPDVIALGGSTVLSATPQGFDYTWSPDATVAFPNEATTEATPSATTTYTVLISDGECLYHQSVTVRVVELVCGPPSIYIPNAFTPNNDGRNEYLYVRGNHITDLHFVLYNRWGEKVFETRSLTDGWDGRYKGRDADPAVFVYYLTAVCEGGETYFEKGNITLIR